jgi:hypothetical protein
MSNRKDDVTWRVAALSKSVQALAQGLIALNDRAFAEDTVLAKAANVTTPAAPSADLERLQARVEHLEEVARLQTLPGGPLDGEALLAKAAGSYADPESLMALGEREIGDATTMGAFSSHISTGNLPAAQSLLIDARERGRVAKAADATMTAQDALEEPFTDFRNRQAVGELVARFGVMERTLASIESRLERLERPQPPAVQPGAQQIAKAAAPGKRRRTPAEEQAHLLAMLDAYIDSPTTAGQVSSMIQRGQLVEARQVLETAKRGHEIQRVREERKTWNR